MQRLSRFRWYFLGLLIVAFAIRVAAGGWWQRGMGEGHRFRFYDSESYWNHAQTIVCGEPYQDGAGWRVFRTPGYPALLAGWFWLAGDDDPPVIWARVLSALLGTLAVGAVVWLAWMLFDPRTALIAGLLAAFYPGAIALSVFVLAEAPFCLWMILQLVLWTLAWRADDAKRRIGFSLTGGILAGAATLCRPSWLLFTPFAIFIGLLVVEQKKKQLVIGATMIGGLCLAMLPWWIRNYQVAGRFVPTTLQVGASLYDGLNPDATGASNMDFVPKFYDEQKRSDRQADVQPHGLFEERLDRRLRNASIDWARENPGQVVRLMGVKFLRIWNVLPNAGELQSWKVRLVVMLGYTPLIVLGIWGAWKFGRDGWPYVLCYLPAIYVTCLHMVFVGSIRYRQPVMLAMIVLAAGVLNSIWKQEKN